MRPFHFGLEAVDSLSIYHRAHSGGESWNARYAKTGERWHIQSATQALLTDTLADAKLINHLLDTLRTLTIEDNQVSGPSDNLGLASPDFSLEWRSEGKTFSLEVGTQDLSTSTAYVRFPHADRDQVFLVKGAAVQMLDHFRTFAETREKRLVGLDLDDVAGVSNPIHAQRLSGGWGDLKNKPYSDRFGEWLDAFLHLRVQAFLEESDPEIKTAKRALSKPKWIIELIDQGDQKTKIEVARVGNRLYAQNRSRNEAIFELPLQAEKHLTVLK